MWKSEHRLAADRRHPCYPSDLTDAEWAIVAAMIPPGRHGGRRRSVNVREVLNGILSRAVDRLPVEGAAEGFAAEEHGATTTSTCGNWDGTLERLHHALYVAGARGGRGVRQARRWRSSTSQTAQRRLKKGASARPVGLRCRARRRTGRKRHILVDTLGLLLNVCRCIPAMSRIATAAIPLAAPDATPVPVHRTHLCRRCISRDEKTADDGVASTGAWKLADRQAIRTLHRIRRAYPSAGSSSAPSRGSAVTAAWPATSNAHAPHRRCLRSPRHDPPHAQATLPQMPIVYESKLPGWALKPAGLLSTGQRVPTRRRGETAIVS